MTLCRDSTKKGMFASTGGVSGRRAAVVPTTLQCNKLTSSVTVLPKTMNQPLLRTMVRQKDCGGVHRRETEAKRGDGGVGSSATEVVVVIGCGVAVWQLQ